jgi:hypothetical protein
MAGRPAGPFQSILVYAQKTVRQLTVKLLSGFPENDENCFFVAQAGVVGAIAAQNRTCIGNSNDLGFNRDVLGVCCASRIKRYKYSYTTGC